MDFVKSDLQGRAMLIKAAFDLFTIMQRRGIQVRLLLGAGSLMYSQHLPLEGCRNRITRQNGKQHNQETGCAVCSAASCSVRIHEHTNISQPYIHEKNLCVNQPSNKQ